MFPELSIFLLIFLNLFSWLWDNKLPSWPLVFKVDLRIKQDLRDVIRPNRYVFCFEFLWLWVKKTCGPHNSSFFQPGYYSIMNFVKIVMSQETTTTLSAGFLFFFNDLTKITLSLSLRGSKYNIIYSTLFSFSKENFLLVLCNLNMCVLFILVVTSSERYWSCRGIYF